jgi:hypothetical protein
VTVNVLAGAGRARLVGVTSYVSYIADAAVVATSASTAIVAGAFAPVVEHVFVMVGIIGDVAPVGVDESLEDWVRGLTGSVAAALTGGLRRGGIWIVGRKMNKKEVNNAVYDGLAKILIPAGFKGNKSDCRFIRPMSFGFQDVGVPLRDYEPVFGFSMNVGLRFDAIQDVANPLYPLDRRYWADAFTVLLKPAYFLGGDMRFEVQTSEEIDQAMTAIHGLLKGHVFPFFDACQDLASVERLLNRDPGNPWTSHQGGHAITGVVAAALCRRPDFADIVARYRTILAGSVEPIRNQFEAAVDQLTAHILPT